MIFVDTSAWVAASMSDDPDHVEANAWLKDNNEQLITSDYVIDETLTLIRMRGQYQRALILGEEFFSGSLGVVHYLSQADILNAWDVFCRFKDKKWSFTDCSSKALMTALNIDKAFSFDQHFQQFGTVTVLPLSTR